VSEFAIRDAEGAPAANGTRYHSGKDWFAPGGSPVSSPISGTVVEVRASRGNTGQVFGGMVKIQGADGRIWVYRHVDPSGASVGQHVDARQTVAHVTDWRSGPDHVHIELWRTLAGGYRYENLIDPMTELRRFLREDLPAHINRAAISECTSKPSSVSRTRPPSTRTHPPRTSFSTAVRRGAAS
jgi:murein DD-endopeptidase MepM/ murein hydrolase activator NlpD